MKKFLILFIILTFALPSQAFFWNKKDKIGTKRKVYFMAKAELFKVPLLGPMIRSFGAFPVTRGVADRRALARAMELMRAGEVVNIFPEGKRSETGEICEPNRGSFDLALKCNAVIVWLSGNIVFDSSFKISTRFFNYALFYARSISFFINFFINFLDLWRS